MVVVVRLVDVVVSLIDNVWEGEEHVVKPADHVYEPAVSNNGTDDCENGTLEVVHEAADYVLESDAYVFTGDEYDGEVEGGARGFTGLDSVMGKFALTPASPKWHPRLDGATGQSRRDDIFVVSQPESPKLRRSDMDLKMPPRRGFCHVWPGGYKDSAPTELPNRDRVLTAPRPPPSTVGAPSL